MKYISIIGATGSVGSQLLSVLSAQKEHFKIRALSGYRNAEALQKLKQEFSPKFIWQEGNDRQDLMSFFTDPQTDLLVLAFGGAESFTYYQMAIESGKDLAIASKEAIIIGGVKQIELAQKKGIKILPLDSEMVALNTLLKNKKAEEIEKVYITCSGGPFLNKKNLNEVTVSEAIKHPRWKMGAKISVESALWINKGYEILEAHILFNLPLEKIEVLIHPQSNFHAFLAFKNGEILAQLSQTDMKIPIAIMLQNYLGQDLSPAKPEKFNFFAESFSFFNPKDFPLYQGIELVLKAYHTGKIEEFIKRTDFLISQFLDYKISFTEIYSDLENLLSK